MPAALLRKNRREREEEEADGRSQEGRGILIGNLRTLRGPRSLILPEFRRRRRLLSGVFFPVLNSSIFFFRFGLLWAELGFGL